MSDKIDNICNDAADNDSGAADTVGLNSDICSAGDYEHRVYLNVLDSFEEAKKKRNSYRKYGTLFFIISGIVFLALMFSLDYKIEFLILWVITDFYCAALMIMSEYRYHQYAQMLCLPDEDEDPEEDELNGSDEDIDDAESDEDPGNSEDNKENV